MSTQDDTKLRVGASEESTTLVLREGDTFWNLADCKYGGKHPIAAIYAINNLRPTLEDRGGKPQLLDPIYYAGRSYVLPAASQIPQLEKEFWLEFDSRTVAERVGKPDEQTIVCIRWDENLSQLSKEKYGGRDGSKAIFQCNEMMPKVAHQGDSRRFIDPVCQAGCSYIFPPVNQIDELELQYEKQIQQIIE